MIDHLVHAQLAAARARLEEVVVGQILDQIAGGEDEVAVPRRATRVLGERALASGYEVMGVPDALDRAQRRARPASVLARRGAGEHRVDGGRDKLDVAVLLRRDVRDQVKERAG